MDIVLPSIHFDAKLSPPRAKRALDKKEADALVPAVSNSVDVKNVGTWLGSLPKQGAQVDTAAAPNTTTCDQVIVPDCLRLLYNFGEGTLQGSSYGIVEYTPQAYLGSDLDDFFQDFAPELMGERPIFDSIDGGVLQTIVESFNYNAESNLDLEYAMVLVAPQQVQLYQVGDLVEGASFNNFLDGIDASYCTYEGGDDPLFDAPYPNPSQSGYQAQDCGTYAPASVISTSYGSNEVDLSPAYEQRQCSEYMKLGLQGVTVLYSSGDNGMYLATDLSTIGRQTDLACLGGEKALPETLPSASTRTGVSTTAAAERSIPPSPQAART